MTCTIPAASPEVAKLPVDELLTQLSAKTRNTIKNSLCWPRHEGNLGRALFEYYEVPATVGGLLGLFERKKQKWLTKANLKNISIAIDLLSQTVAGGAA